MSRRKRKYKFETEIVNSNEAVISPSGKVHMGMDGNYFTVCGYEVADNPKWSLPPGDTAEVDCQRCVFNRKGY